MFERFQEAVRNTYLQSKKNDFGREYPSPTKLRNWCLTVWSKGLSKEDEEVFAIFFGHKAGEKTIEQTINKFNTDKFRPLINFIKGETKRRPGENLVKLLAVLIDFKPRPFRNADWIDEPQHEIIAIEETLSAKTDQTKKDVLSDNTIAEEQTINPEKIVDVEATKESNDKIPTAKLLAQTSPNSKQKAKRQTFFLASIVAVGLSAALYFFPSKQCMCWVEDQYVLVDCKERNNESIIIALNEDRLHHFKKITRPDTLTAEDENRIWYSKINHQVEFFTGPGFHPIHDHRSLKAATAYIIEEYAQKTKQTKNERPEE